MSGLIRSNGKETRVMSDDRHRVSRRYFDDCSYFFLLMLLD